MVGLAPMCSVHVCIKLWPFKKRSSGENSFSNIFGKLRIWIARQTFVARFDFDLELFEK